MTMENDVKIVNGYEKSTGKYVKVRKIPGAPGTNLSKIELE